MSILGPHCGAERDDMGSLLAFFHAGTLGAPLGLDLSDDCASLPRSVEARPCKDDHDSHSPDEAVEPFLLFVDVGCTPSCARLVVVLAPTSPGCRLDRCVTGIGETPLGGFFGVAIESEEDDAAPVATDSESLPSSNEMSLRLRGRIVEVVLLEEGKRLSLLFIVAAAADKLDSEIFALGTGDA